MNRDEGVDTLQDLFAAAREDAPSAATRDAVWQRVVSTTVPPLAGSAPAMAKAAGTKLLALGTVLGATGAVVAVLVGTSLAPSDGEAVRPSRVRHTPAGIDEPRAGARPADVVPRGRSSAPADTAAQGEASPPAAVELAAAPPLPETNQASALAEEARLVTDARRALVRSEPERALALVRRTHVLAARSLEPEELGLEARALRALGRTDEALATELALRRRFPGHALAR